MRKSSVYTKSLGHLGGGRGGFSPSVTEIQENED